MLLMTEYYGLFGFRSKRWKWCYVFVITTLVFITAVVPLISYVRPIVLAYEPAGHRYYLVLRVIDGGICIEFPHTAIGYIDWYVVFLWLVVYPHIFVLAWRYWRQRRLRRLRGFPVILKYETGPLSETSGEEK